MGLLCLEQLGAGWGQTMALCPLGQGVEQDGPPSGPGWHEGMDSSLGLLIPQA